ncbi:hypothetical protein [Streptomyces finlayi]|uniref:hypothetical protein n=1 Tax=Streptomyces finlayi TaxID=67296 RepID=UPI0021566973|nr:hypothetical protein [Streptomyces finlayi]
MASPQDDASANRPLTGSAAAVAGTAAPVTVTLVTGDQVLVSADRAGTHRRYAVGRRQRGRRRLHGNSVIQTVVAAYGVR